MSDIEKNEPCDNVGYAISSRTLDCTSDVELANARFETFRDSTRCVADKVEQEDFACAVGINKLTCDDVEAFGDAIDLWLSSTEGCDVILALEGEEVGE